jgi:hypothetical protein
MGDEKKYGITISDRRDLMIDVNSGRFAYTFCRFASF